MRRHLEEHGRGLGFGAQKFVRPSLAVGRSSVPLRWSLRYAFCGTRETAATAASNLAPAKREAKSTISWRKPCARIGSVDASSTSAARPSASESSESKLVGKPGNAASEAGT
eukprot:scaffold26736_cov30-Tisochrysis_lutea.AAC.2